MRGISNFGWLCIAMIAFFIAMAYGETHSQPQTPEQKREDAYYRCVNRQSVERGDITVCNDIK